MVNLKNLKWSGMGHPMIGKRHVTPEELVWLAEHGHYPRKEKIKKNKPAKLPKVQKSEAEIATQYANIIMKKQRTRGQLSSRFSEMETDVTFNKDLWMDTDFYFSVVFQSKRQKIEFLAFLEEKFNIDFEYSDENAIQILNGLKLAKNMGLELKKEVASEYPCGNIELKSFILDEERK